MNIEQVEWAIKHDWYFGFEFDEHLVEYWVWVKENGDIHPYPFRDFEELKRWAGY